MNVKILFSFLLLLTACAPTQAPERKTASATKKGKYFEDITEQSGVPDISGLSIIVGDYDNDQFPDFLIHDRLFKNVYNHGQIQFEDVTSRVGLEKLSGYPVFMDVNNDGALDIVTTKGMVFIQDKTQKKFVDESAKYGLKLDDHAFDLSFADVNGDGFADLLVGSSEVHENDQFTFIPSHFFINMNGNFFKEDKRFALEKYPAYTRGMQWADFDNDNDADVYFSNYRLRQNWLFRNDKGSFSEVAPQYKVQGEYSTTKYMDPYYKKNYGPQYGHTIGSVWADFNNDGNFDLWVANLVHKFVGKSSSGAYDIRGYVCDDSKIYRNNGAPKYDFTDMRSVSGIPLMPMGDYSKYKGDELWSHIMAADFDNDGLIDTYISQVYNLNYAYSLLFKNQGNFKFNEVSANEPTRVIDSYGAAWADFDNDGKMDLLVSGREAVDAPAKLKVFRNIYQSKNHFVKIRLIGTKSGKNPVTTQVRVKTDKGVYLRQYEGVSGTMSQQNDPMLHFGLGDSTIIKSVEVRWNSGKRQNVTGVTIDKNWNVTESN